MRSLAVAAAPVLNQCGGGGHAAAPALPAPAVNVTPAVQTGEAEVTFTIAVPTRTGSSATRRPSYVSPSTKSMAVAVNGGSMTSINLTPYTVSCSNAYCLASVAVSAPVGTDTFTIALYDAVNGSGNVLARQSLSTSVVNGTNTIPLTLSGVVKSVSVSPSTLSVTVGTSGSNSLSVYAYDADGNIIVSPGGYVDASGNALTLTLTDGDTTGATSLSTTSITPSTSSVTLNFNGATASAGTISVSVSGGTILGSVSPAVMNVAQLVPNGNFLSQTVTPTTQLQAVPTDWSQVGPYALYVDGADHDVDLPLTTQQAVLMENNGTGISQTVTGLISGATYALQIYAASAGSNAGLTMIANGATIYSTPITFSGYQTVTSQTFTTSSTSAVIEIIDNGLNGDLEATNVYLIQQG